MVEGGNNNLVGRAMRWGRGWTPSVLKEKWIFYVIKFNWQFNQGQISINKSIRVCGLVWLLKAQSTWIFLKLIIGQLFASQIGRQKMQKDVSPNWHTDNLCNEFLLTQITVMIMYLYLIKQSPHAIKCLLTTHTGSLWIF